ncbi:hypothetical protein [[Kitasatospora] papulosa]|uniref:hypothetical protein n=1 Tax=[Kitasatospora] papulosa TaxID=1464011 RepID=UPI002E2EF86B|nr:hypothetical protein [[Kitasatospora] papulosa]
MSELNEVQMNRLIHTKALFERALRISREAHPFDADSLLLFHDSVENLLHQAIGFLGVELQKSSTFESYWKATQDQKNIVIPGRGPMKRMNDARVGFKHHGLIPSSSTIEQVRADVQTFFTDTVPMVFNVDFEKISMELLIEDTNARDLISEADMLAALGTPNSIAVAMLYLHDAFQMLFNPFIKPELHRADFPALRRASRGTDWEHLLSIVETDISVQQYYWPVFLLGLEYTEYSKFVNLVPRHHGGPHWPGSRTEPGTELWFEPKFMTLENFEFSRAFLVRAAIRAKQLYTPPQPIVYSGETVHATLKELLRPKKRGSRSQR